jgi:hypothetical protein
LGTILEALRLSRSSEEPFTRKEDEMPRGRRHTPEQIVQLLRQIETDTASGKKTDKACYEAGISEPTYYRWYQEFGNLNLDQAERQER